MIDPFLWSAYNENDCTEYQKFSFSSSSSSFIFRLSLLMKSSIPIDSSIAVIQIILLYYLDLLQAHSVELLMIIE